MYVYIYTYICLYIHIYMYIYICICIHVHTYIYVNMYVPASKHPIWLARRGSKDVDWVCCMLPPLLVCAAHRT